ncbi:MAG: YHS domain-containing protein [Planctomycetota bacterium]
MRHYKYNHSSKDPVCSTVISMGTPLITYRYNGKIFYFCSVTCRSKFSKRPQRYFGKHRHRKFPPRMSLPIGRMKPCYHY